MWWSDDDRIGVRGWKDVWCMESGAGVILERADEG